MIDEPPVAACALAPDGNPVAPSPLGATKAEEKNLKVRNSLRSLKNRHRDCRVVRRKGRVYVINKTQRKFKARQG